MYHMKDDLNENLKSGTLYSIDKMPWSDGIMSYYMSNFSQHGNSGSVVFTSKGQCLGILVGSRHNNSGNYSIALPYDLIPTTFEKIVGRPLYNEISLKEFFTQFMYDYWEEITPNSIVSSDTTLPEETSESESTNITQ